MSPAEKLARVEELIATRYAITGELLALMGGTPDDQRVIEPPVKDGENYSESTGAKAPRKCSICFGAGHSARTCEKNKTDNFGFKAEAKGACAECGSPSRHKSTCSKASAKKAAATGDESAQSVRKTQGRTILDEPLRLTEEEYNDVCNSIADGISISNIGFSYPHIELSELWKAAETKSYETYLRK